MARGAYYNEIDPFAAAWLRELIKAGLIADGEVDERDIRDVQPADLARFVQCHFFAGIGGWSYALRLAGWDDARPVWTGSCPCQPFSAAGKRQGGADDRHLWPHWARLIRECHPVTIFGEQVESAVAHGWLDAVFDDLERETYACGAAALPAASVGAPHIRQRVWFVAESDGRQSSDGELQRSGRHLQRSENSTTGISMADAQHAERRPICLDRQDGRDRTHSGREEAHGEFGTCGEVRSLADAECGARQQRRSELGSATRNTEGTPSERERLRAESRDGGESDGMADAMSAGWPERGPSARNGSATRSRWADCDWIACRDGKARPTQSGLFPLAHGVSGRVGRLRGYGNAIVPQVAAAFIESYLDISPETV